jgi:hypothetical protein
LQRLQTSRNLIPGAIIIAYVIRGGVRHGSIKIERARWNRRLRINSELFSIQRVVLQRAQLYRNLPGSRFNIRLRLVLALVREQDCGHDYHKRDGDHELYQGKTAFKMRLAFFGHRKNLDQK